MSAVDRLGREIYHTNVFLSVGAVVVVVCLEAVLAGEREELQASLARHGRHILVISQLQVTSAVEDCVKDNMSACVPKGGEHGWQLLRGEGPAGDLQQGLGQPHPAAAAARHTGWAPSSHMSGPASLIIVSLSEQEFAS